MTINMETLMNSVAIAVYQYQWQLEVRVEGSYTVIEFDMKYNAYIDVNKYINIYDFLNIYMNMYGRNYSNNTGTYTAQSLYGYS